MKHEKHDDFYKKLFPKERENLANLIDNLGMEFSDAMQSIVRMVNREEVNNVQKFVDAMSLTPPEEHFFKRLLAALHGYLADNGVFIRDANIKVMLCNLPRHVEEHKPYWFNGLQSPDYVEKMVNILYPDQVELAS